MRALRVARRYILSTMPPELLWGLWTNWRDMVPNNIKERLEKLYAAIPRPEIKDELHTIQELVANHERLVKQYEPKFKPFRNVREWTPELTKAVQELALDRNLRKQLRKYHSIDTEKLYEGVDKFLNDLSDEALFNEFSEEIIPIVYGYAEEEGEYDQDDARKAIQPLKGKSFSKEILAWDECEKAIPEVVSTTTEEGSYRYFVDWIKRLDQAIEQGPEPTLEVLDNWEDAIPYGLGGGEFATELDTDVYDGNDSRMYWYNHEAEALEDQISRMARSLGSED